MKISEIEKLLAKVKTDSQAVDIPELMGACLSLVLSIKALHAACSDIVGGSQMIYVYPRVAIDRAKTGVEQVRAFGLEMD